MILPAADWRSHAGLHKLTHILQGDAEARFVGGAVRDTLLGIPTKDVDIATRHAPDLVMDLLKRAGIKAVPTGLAHGTITAVLPSGPVEVTTLRRDVSTDGRHALITFTDDWREDAARRDFTMNALYAEPKSGAIHDYFGGLADLKARHVRFIGDPLQRIAEDHLRILRFFRFLARFGDVPDTDGLNACASRANDLMALSRERIADELLKLLVAKDAPRVVALMLERGILQPVLPEITNSTGLETLVGREHMAGIEPDPVRRLAALLSRDPEIADTVAARLRFSNTQRKRLVSAMGAMPAETPAVLAYRLGIETAVDRLLLSERDPNDAALAWAITPSRLPIGGGELVSRGVRKGPDVARLLHSVEDRWIAEGFPDAVRTSAIADEVVAQWLGSTSSL